MARQVKVVLDGMKAYLRQSSSQVLRSYLDADLMRYATEGQRSVARELSRIGASYFITTQIIDLTANQQIYTQPRTVKKVLQVKLILSDGSESEIDPANGWEEFHEFNRGLSAATMGPYGSAKYLFAGQDLWMAPKPSSGVTNGLHILNETRVVPEGGFTLDTEELVTPEEWDHYSVLIACSLAVPQDTEDPTSYFQMSQAFRRGLDSDFVGRGRKGKAQYVRHVDPYE
jgi:hypothetical protein